MIYILRNNEDFHSGRKQMVVTLRKDDLQILSVVYDVALHTARLEGGGMRRVFMIYTEGKRLPKTILKNEYGFDIGVINPALATEEFGCIQFYDMLYYYNLSCRSTGLLSIYENPDAAPLLNIDIERSNGILGNDFNYLSSDYFTCQLMSICWYLQLPVKQTELLQTSTLTSGQQMVRI